MLDSNNVKISTSLLVLGYIAHSSKLSMTVMENKIKHTEPYGKIIFLNFSLSGQELRRSIGHRLVFLYWNR